MIGSQEFSDSTATKLRVVCGLLILIFRFRKYKYYLKKYINTPVYVFPLPSRGRRKGENCFHDPQVESGVCASSLLFFESEEKFLPDRALSVLVEV